ncbi:hypothetical protein ACG7TL_002224 [Trametes sanguinea]
MSLPSGYTSRVRALLLKPSIEHVQYITIPYRVTFPTAFAEVTPEVGFYFTECEPQYTLYTKGLDGRVLRNPFQIWYCPNSFKRFSPVNHPVARLAHGLARKAWYGPVVILKYSGILRQSYWDVNEDFQPFPPPTSLIYSANMEPPLPSVPRNGLEWAQAFRRADKVDRFTLTTLSGDNLSITSGSCVSLKPDGSRRNDASNPDAELFAQVVGTVIHFKYGKLVRLRWFIHQEEFSESVAGDDATKALVPTIGDKELIQHSHETYQFADRIHRKVPIVAFSPSRLGLPVIDDMTYYTRTTLSVKWALEPHTITIASTHNDSICSRDCNLNNLVDVNEELIMRFCELCQCWFHKQCLVVSPATVPTLEELKATRPPQPEDEAEADYLYNSGQITFSGHDFTIWMSLLHRPIQRGYSEYPWLLSFERLLDAVRRHDRAWGCPSDVQDFVTQHLSMAPSLVHLTDKYRAIVQAPYPDIYYYCPDCDSAI